MAKLTRTKAKKRLREAEAKFQKVYMWQFTLGHSNGVAVTTKDMDAIEKIVQRCINRIP